MGKITKALKYAIKVRTQKPIKPRFIEFDITKNCNSKCKYCDIWQGKKKGKDMTTSEIRRAFNDSKDFLSDVEYIVVTGGEPTLRPDIKEVYDILHNACPNATLQLSTNGLLPNRVLDIVMTNIDNGIKMDVGISLDGIGSTHDRIRGVKGCFKRVNSLVDSLLVLQKKYPKQLGICLGMTISNLTVKSYPKIKAYAEKKGLPLEYAWIEQTPYYDNADKSLGISNKGTMDIVKDIPDSKRKQDWIRHIKGESIRFDCYALRTFFVLKYNGDIVPCLHYYDKVVGNVRKESISYILNHKWNTMACKSLVVGTCEGCLNTWAYSESHMAKLTPYMKYYLMHPKALVKELKR